jgi:hypothetical protein
MSRRVSQLTAACVILLGLGSSGLAAQGHPFRSQMPLVPSNIEVPPGHSIFLQGYAVGTQNFVCLQTGSGLTWRFMGPQATLFLMGRDGLSQQIATHFLAANPSEGGVLRPAWQHSFDTSQVWGRVLASSSDPAFVQPGAISWLLLEVAGAQRGPTGSTLLAHATFIQRVNTSGGVAPATGCSQAGDVGTMALVPYTTDYYFYRTNRNH